MLVALLVITPIPLIAALFLAEANGFLYCDCQLPCQVLVGFVVWYVETIEAVVVVSQCEI
jgi:hypothetical protein